MGCSSLQWGAAPCNGVQLLAMGADLQVALQRVAAPCSGLQLLAMGAEVQLALQCLQTHSVHRTACRSACKSTLPLTGFAAPSPPAADILPHFPPLLFPMLCPHRLHQNKLPHQNKHLVFLFISAPFFGFFQTKPIWASHPPWPKPKSGFLQ